MTYLQYFVLNYTCPRPYIVYMLRESEIREDWAAIMLAVKQCEENLRVHDGQLLRIKFVSSNLRPNS